MRNWKSDIEAFCVIAGFYLFLQMVLGIGCPVKFLTGVSDAGCGMSRAWLSVLHLDFAGAFYYHPLWMLPAPAVFVILFKKRIPDKTYRLLVICFVAAFLMVYGYRMFFMPDQDIVVFRPWEGFIWRSIETIAIVIKSLL
ncbi:MAG: DUF2752 domain-containing protein [Oribacterium sp.]|nr:DUF2752 domain-containing protein [Oribacterium sp.]